MNECKKYQYYGILFCLIKESHNRNIIAFVCNFDSLPWQGGFDTTLFIKIGQWLSPVDLFLSICLHS